MRFTRIVASLAVGTVAALGLGIGSAGAAGPPVDRFDGIYITCDGIGDQFIVSIPGNGDWTPGPVLGTNTVLVPYQFHFEFSFTPNGGTTQTESEDLAKRPPANATLDRCTGHGEFADADGTYTFDFIAWVAVRGH